jgi:hypothetical protein
MKVLMLLALAGLSISATQAAEQAVMLACQGTVKTYKWDKDTNKSSVEEEPVSMNIGVNFTAQKVEGFEGLPAEISLMNELSIVFSSHSYYAGTTSS